MKGLPMKGLLIAAALGLGLWGASVPTGGAALASEKDNNRPYGASVYKYFGAQIYGAPRHNYRPAYRRGHHRNDRPAPHRRAQRHDHRERYAYSAPRKKYRRERMDYQVTRPCRATSKIGFAHGRRARIGGTLCYNAYGTPYIVQGSRYIIQYF